MSTDRPESSVVRGVELATAIVFTVTLLALPSVASGHTLMRVVGPLATPVLWMPAAIWAAAALARAADQRLPADILSCVARISFWLVGGLVLLDPAVNGPDQLGSWLGSMARSASEGVRIVLLGGLAVVVAGVVLSAMLGSSGGPEKSGARRRVSTGSAIHPVAALFLRLVGRASLRLMGWVCSLVLVALGWTVAGVPGAMTVLRGRESDGRILRPLVLARLLVARATGGAWESLASLSRSWGRREHHEFIVEPCALVRDEADSVATEPWPHHANATEAERELAELAEGLIAAYDVALMSEAKGKAAGQGEGHDPRRAAPRLYPYRLEVVRAWSRPGYHALVLRATPATAAAAMARVASEQLVPVLDASTRWTRQELARLRLSDRRVAADELRGGQVGLFIAFDRDAEGPDDAAIRSGPEPVERALAETGLTDRFHHLRSDEGFESDTHDYAARFTDAAEWRELEQRWRALQPAVAVYGRSPDARLEALVETQSFRVTIPKRPPAFPSGDATDWRRVVARHRGLLAGHPLRFIVGVDHQEQPVTMELGTATPHLLIAGGTGSGKSRSGVFSPLAQLLSRNTPADLRLWLLDSVKREMSSLFGDAPHVERRTVAEDGDDVVRMLADFTETMDARYRELGGRQRTADDGPVHLLVIEEWADLRDLLDREQLEGVLRSANRVGQLGRAAGCHLMLVTQKASAEVIPPRLKSNFKGRMCGFFSQASDYGIALDIHRRLLPNVPGRLAISDGSELRIVQGLHIDDETIREVVGGPSSDGGREASRVVTVEAEPRAPTAREVENLSRLTLARVLYRWQAAEGDPLLVSVRGAMDRVRSLGFVAGRAERYTARLASLEDAGILERAADHATASRRLVAMPWQEVERRLGVSGDVSLGP